MILEFVKSLLLPGLTVTCQLFVIPTTLLPVLFEARSLQIIAAVNAATIVVILRKQLV